MNLSIDEVCEYIEDYVVDIEVSKKIIGLLKSGHECRNALLSLCPYSSWAEEIIERYDEYWLG